MAQPQFLAPKAERIKRTGVGHNASEAARTACLPCGLQRWILPSMSVTADKIAEVLALPEEDRAFLARELIASLDPHREPDAETQWNEVIKRRSREIEEGKVSCRPVGETVREIRAKLNARHQPS